MGYSSRSHHSNYTGGTPVGDSLLGIKYLLGDFATNADPAYDEIWTDEENKTKLYENPYALSIAYTVADDFELFDATAANSPFELMNRMCAEMLGRERVELFSANKYDANLENVSQSSSNGMRKYTKNKDTGARISFVITAESDGVMYAYFPVTNGYRRDISIKYNDTTVKKYLTSDNHGILCLGNYKRGEIAYLTVTLDEDNVYFDPANYFYTLDSKVLDSVMGDLKKGDASLNVNYSDTNFSGSVNADNGRNTLMLSMPYDENIAVYVNSKRVDTFEVAGIFTGVRIEDGVNEFEVKYIPKQFYFGLLAALAGVIVLLSYKLLQMRACSPNQPCVADESIAEEQEGESI